MKRLFIFLICSTATFCNAQFYVSNKANVYVSESTLLYSTKDLKVAGEGSKVNSIGNIRVENGDFVTQNANQFILRYQKKSDNFDISKNVYGQLILGDVVKVADNSKITQGAVLGSNSSEGSVYFMVPFVGYGLADLQKDLGLPNLPVPVAGCTKERCFKGGWDGSNVFGWSNPLYRSEVVEANDKFDPGRYYFIRKKVGGKLSNYDSNAVIDFEGVPFNLAARDAKVYNAVNGGKVQSLFAVNSYGLIPWTYLKDPFLVIQNQKYKEDPTGKSLSQKEKEEFEEGYHRGVNFYANPYTSNLDIRKLLSENEVNKYIQGIGFQGLSDGIDTDKDNTFGKTPYYRYVTKYSITKYDIGTNQYYGDRVTIIPPFSNFLIKLDEGKRDQANQVRLNYGVKAQTFIKPKQYNINDNNSPDVQQSKVASNSSGDKDLYQIKLFLAKDNEIVNYTYVVTSSSFTTGDINQDVPSEDAKLAESSGTNQKASIYTLAENPDGGINPAYKDGDKIYINTFGINSVGVPIPVGVTIDKDGGKYSVLAKLTENEKPVEGKFSKPDTKFFFHDKKLDKVIEIDSNFKYDITDLAGGATDDRFEIFWKKVKSDKNIDINNSPVIYKKDGGKNYIKFPTSWTSAQVFIYTSVGQLVANESVSNTKEDKYLNLPNDNSSMYVVKILDQDGKSYTKKVIK